MNTVKVERAGKARPKRPHHRYRASTYLTAAEYAALERAAAAQQRTVAGLVRAIVLGFLGQEKATDGPAPSGQTPSESQQPFSVAPVTQETPRRSRATMARNWRSGSGTSGRARS